MDLDNSMLRVGEVTLFWRIATESYLKVRQLDRKIKEWQRTMNRPDSVSRYAYDEGHDPEFAEWCLDEAMIFADGEVQNLADLLVMHARITVVFSAMTAEAYIWDYAARNFSSSFVKKYIDRLDVISKWVIVPQLVAGGRFPTEGEAFELLKDLIRNRNSFVHHKTTFFPEDPEEMHAKLRRTVSEEVEKAERAVEAIKKLVMELCNIDPVVAEFEEVYPSSSTATIYRMHRWLRGDFMEEEDENVEVHYDLDDGDLPF